MRAPDRTVQAGLTRRRRSSPPGPVRTIEVATGVGSGPTRLAAFDAALVGAGVGNFNLVPLSSVIPPGSVVAPAEDGVVHVDGQWGDRLYVVMAESGVDEPGQQAWAAIGWVQDPRCGKGLFVEHDGHSEAEVLSDVDATLTSIAARRGQSFGPPQCVIQGTVCRDEPACALVVAVFEAAPWTNPWSEPVITLP